MTPVDDKFRCAKKETTTDTWLNGKLRLNCININSDIALFCLLFSFPRHYPTRLSVAENNIKQHQAHIQPNTPPHTIADTKRSFAKREAFECISDLYNEWNIGKKFLLTLSLLQFVRRVSWEKYFLLRSHRWSEKLSKRKEKKCFFGKVFDIKITWAFKKELLRVHHCIAA